MSKVQALKEAVRPGFKELKRRTERAYQRIIRDTDWLEQPETFLITVHGQDTDVERVERDLDMMGLYNEDVDCPITSKPVEIGNKRLYFTRGGFVGTMALNADTLLSGDAYKPDSVEKKQTQSLQQVVKRWSNVDNNHSGDKSVEDLKDAFDVEDDDVETKEDAETWREDLRSLKGSKKTNKTHNQAEREKKLLKVTDTDKVKAVGMIAVGVVVGIMIAQKWM